VADGLALIASLRARLAENEGTMRRLLADSQRTSVEMCRGRLADIEAMRRVIYVCEQVLTGDDRGGDHCATGILRALASVASGATR
jgi:hypothetical protein